MVREVSYLDIAAALTERLGTAAVGSRFASEHELVVEFGVSRPTARAALQELERRFLVRRVRGAGTFVNRRVDYVIGAHVPPSGTATFARSGVTPTIRVLTTGIVGAVGEVAERLGMPAEAPVVEIVRLTSVDGHVAGHTTTRLPDALVPGIGEHVGDDVSLFTLLQDRYGLEPVRVWSRATTEVPPPGVAAALGLDTTDPSWLIVSVNRDRRSGRRIEHTTTWMRADTVRVVVELEER